MKYKIKLALLVSFFLLLMGCKASPVLNIEDTAIVTTAENITVKNITQAIVRAGSSLGWAMKKKGDNEIIGILHLRKHMATVSIKYTTGLYSIKYVDSLNLNYDGTNIHGNYNGWVQNLNTAIQTQLNIM